jgi:hypothetical protein
LLRGFDGKRVAVGKRELDGTTGDGSGFFGVLRPSSISEFQTLLDRSEEVKADFTAGLDPPSGESDVSEDAPESELDVGFWCVLRPL